MKRRRNIYPLIITLLLCLWQVAGIDVYAQERSRAEMKRLRIKQADTTQIAQPNLPLRTDSIRPVLSDSVRTETDSLAAENRRKMLELTSAPQLEEQPVPTDSLNNALPIKRWTPNPTKATWLALVIPGGGQIYNRKYWKLPIVYGGFAGCAYALTWNNKMYKDYSAAYKDAVNGNWDSTSITDLLPPGYRYSESQLTETLRKRKDSYRRFRDLSIFAFIGVYLLSVVDAYVDAELSNFDIGPDLSMRVEPAMIDSQPMGYAKKSVGVQCSFSF